MDRISVVPLGVDLAFNIKAPAFRRKTYLVSLGTITEVKMSLELAKLARGAKVPILFIGKPYSTTDPYWHRFQREIDGVFVKLKDHVDSRDELISLMNESSGFVLYSKYENWSLAAHEAAALGLPLLLPDKTWSRERFGESASYFPRRRRYDHIDALKKFYNSTSPPLHTGYIPAWSDTAQQLKNIYNAVLKAG
jgi:glycosyltransferase involved in cell wall biosynthesis